MVGDDYGWKDWIDQKLTDCVATWYANPATNYGWVMDYTYYSGSTDGVEFWSDDSGGWGPKLSVDYYIIPEPASLCLLGLGGLALLRKRRASM